MSNITNINPEAIRALALDLDGTTLAPGAVLKERTVRAVKKCMERGIRIIIATGRPPEAIEPFRSALGIQGPVICLNGAAVVNMPKDEILNSTLLGKDLLEFCIDLSREMQVFCLVFFPGSGLQADDSKIVFMGDLEGPKLDICFNEPGFRAELVDLKEMLSRPGIKGCLKCMYYAEPKILDIVRPRLHERLGESAYIVRSLPTYLEIMNVKVSKGQGLKFVMEHFSLKSEEVIAFGDEENDLPMFCAAGFSAAPANAKEKVKAAASLVIGSNAEDGVAVFLEKFFGF